MAYRDFSPVLSLQNLSKCLLFFLLQFSSFTIFFFILMQSVSINEFLKPAEGERYYSPGGRGRGRGRGRGDRGRFSNGYSPRDSAAPAPAIQDQAQFPSLGGGK